MKPTQAVAEACAYSLESGLVSIHELPRRMIFSETGLPVYFILGNSGAEVASEFVRWHHTAVVYCKGWDVLHTWCAPPEAACGVCPDRIGYYSAGE